MRTAYITTLSALLIGSSGCSAPKRPDFYPNDAYQRAGSSQVEAATQYCMSLADEYVKQPDKFNDAVKQGAAGGVIGAGTGALGGVIMGNNVGRSVGAGAAIGGVLGILRSLYETSDHSPSYERFVERCLAKQGFEVTGWSR